MVQGLHGTRVYSTLYVIKRGTSYNEVNNIRGTQALSNYNR